ncbi:MAG: ABC transporter permease [Anaerolineae bacterium]|nr:ABC transporter permease [Anaerolineae bacterium]
MNKIATLSAPDAPVKDNVAKLGAYLLQLLPFVGLSFIVGSLLVLWAGENPLEVYSLVLKETLFDELGLMIAVQRATPLILTSAAAAMAFRAGAINMGLAGQFTVGASIAAIAGYALPAMPKPLHILAIMALCGVGGAAAAFIPAIFKRLSGVNEVITGMIANLLIPHLMSFFINLFPAVRAARFGASSSGIRESAQFLQFSELTGGALGAGTKANTGIFFALGLVLFLAIWMRYSTLGYELRMTKLNPSFAEFGGIRAGRYFFVGMLLSGAIAAMAGAVEILGIWRGYRLGTLEIGNKGLVIALIGQQSFIGSLLASLFFGGLEAGAMKVTWYTPIPRPLVDILVEITIVLVALPSMRAFISGDPDSDVDRLGGRFVPRK